jgi:glucan 1,3-beta-glucosidase
MSKFDKKIRGVNLGNWLVLEKWMSPSVFEGLDATDETTWCVELGNKASMELHHHWDTWITEEDFKWIAERGLNSVRIPVGYWIFGNGVGYPYHGTFKDDILPFVDGGIYYLDKAFEWANKYNLNIVIDLHTAPGCQNGFDNGGLHGICEWTSKEIYIQHAVDTIERLAGRYAGNPALYGIEVLNEPRWDIPTDLLKNYNVDCYHAIRTWCDAEDVAVIYMDGFRPHSEYDGFMLEGDEYKNVMMDYHRYQCFTREEQNKNIYEHVAQTSIDWVTEVDYLKKAGHRAYCGEWSLGLDLEVVSLWAEPPFNHALEKMDSFQMDTALKLYASAQLMTFEKLNGWFFWSYKVENALGWSFRQAVERGWLPSQFNNSKIETIK